MSFCTKCGTELKEDAKFCPSCGAPTEQKAEPAAEEKQPEQNTYQQNTYQQNTTSDFAQKFDQFTDTEDRTAEFDKADISANKVYAILAYIGFLVLVPLIAVPKSKFARFHANQGLVLLIGEVAYNIVRSVLVYVLRLTMWGPLRIVCNRRGRSCFCGLCRNRYRKRRTGHCKGAPACRQGQNIEIIPH